MSNPFQQVIDESASVDHSINDDDYYIVHPDKKHIVSKVYTKVPYGQRANAVLKPYIDSADKKHGPGHKAVKGMHLKREAGYTRLSEATEYADVISRSVLGSYSTNVDEANYHTRKKMAIATAVAKRVAESEQLDEAGPFSYGSKTPRKGSSAYEAMMERKEQDKNYKPIEPKDNMSGIGKLTKEDVEQFDEAIDWHKDNGNWDAAKKNGKAHFDKVMAAAKNKTDAALKLKNDGHSAANKGSYVGAVIKGLANDYFDRQLRDDVNREVELDVFEEASVASESMVAREVGGRKFVSAEAAIRLAREIAAKRKEGEKATHKDLIAAKKKLVGEETDW